MSAAALLAFVTTAPVTAQQPPSPPATTAMDSRPGPAIVLLPADGDANSVLRAPVRAVPGVAGATQAFTATAQVTYSSTVPGQPFPPDAVAAVQAAIDVWMGYLTSSVPITIRVNWRSFAADVLAGAGPTRIYKNFPNAPVPNVYYPSALAEALAGQPLANSDPDVQIDIKNRSDWSYATDGTPVSGQFDLMTTIMHELGHGWGYLGTMEVSGGVGNWGIPSDPSAPDIYDKFTEDIDGGKLLTTYPDDSTQLAAALQSNAVYFSSPQTNTGSADRFRLFAPTSWLPGSSYSHPSESTYGVGNPESLMTPYINRAEIIHAAGPQTLCLLEALGWTTSQVCPVSGQPQQTQVQGSTWYSDGTTAKSGLASTVITAYATNAAAGSYKLVTGTDGGTGQPCRFDVVAVNPNVRVANSRGFIPSTSGAVNRAPGQWQVCFRQEGSGTTLRVTQPVTFTVSP